VLYLLGQGLRRGTRGRKLLAKLLHLIRVRGTFGRDLFKLPHLGLRLVALAAEPSDLSSGVVEKIVNCCCDQFVEGRVGKGRGAIGAQQSEEALLLLAGLVGVGVPEGRGGDAVEDVDALVLDAASGDVVRKVPEASTWRPDWPTDTSAAIRAWSRM